MYLFTSNDFSGTEVICDEGELFWIPINQVETLNLWEGDKVFLPKLETDEEINIKLIYNNDKFIGWEKL